MSSLSSDKDFWELWNADQPNDRQEARYVDVDGEGNFLNVRRPKWTKPKGRLQAEILAAVGQKYYQDRDEQSAVNHIAKQSLSLTKVESPFPLEWVRFCCEWAKKKRAKREWVGLKGLLTFIMDEDKKQKWLDKNREKYESKSWDDIANTDLD